MGRTIFIRKEPCRRRRRRRRMSRYLIYALFLLATWEVAAGRRHRKGKAKVSLCTRVIRSQSDLPRNGSTFSPNYPNAYESGIFCKYRFIAGEKERVKLTLNVLDLYVPGEEVEGRFGMQAEELDCDGIDNLEFLDIIKGKEAQLRKICGRNRMIPRNNGVPYSFMSSGNELDVVFSSIQREGGRAPRGFEIAWRFVKDFGVRTGRQDANEDCAFYFNSSVSINGSIASPNFPGFYPRNTFCDYFFFGSKWQRLKLTFTYFDVEGMSSCEDDSNSDYVLFSNFRTRDRSMIRYCGHIKPRLAKSEHSFFRVTFSSNGVYDGTGFLAKYEFYTYEDASQTATAASVSGADFARPSAAWTAAAVAAAAIATALLSQQQQFPSYAAGRIAVSVGVVVVVALRILDVVAALAFAAFRRIFWRRRRTYESLEFSPSPSTTTTTTTPSRLLFLIGGIRLVEQKTRSWRKSKGRPF